ncbi:MAG: VWA domain-containing protein, partial [Bryobacteraceae bacterium]
CGLLATSVIILPALAKSRHQPIEPENAFRTSSDLVLINARVLDGRGHPLAGLEAGQFHLFEDGVEQKLVAFNQGDVPVSIVLVFDTSNSMKRLLGRSREAVSLLLKAGNPEDEFALVDFSDRPSLALNWTGDLSQVHDYLSHTEPHGTTALLDAIVLGGSVARHAHSVRRVLVVISDGGDNHSRHGVAEVRRYLLEAGVEVYAVNIMNDFPQPTWTADGPLLLAGICWAGGGESVQIQQSTNLAGVIEQVAREIRSQYILSYQPSTLARPGKYHRVNLKVSPPPGTGRVYVSWRHGYYEPRD